MVELDLVARELTECGFTEVFTTPVGVSACAEPIVLRPGAWERESRQADGGERGARAVEVLVVRESDEAAAADSFEVERALRSAPWAGAPMGGVRVVAVDSAAPDFIERDGSGRYVWGLSCTLTIVRGFDG